MSQPVSGEGRVTIPNGALLLIDDELVAVSNKEGTDWPSIMPTLVGLDEAGLRLAIERGVKSLLMRGIIERSGAGDVSAEVMERVGIALRGAARFRSFVGTGGFGYDVGFSTTTAYELDGSWLMEMTSPFGVHYLSETDQEGMSHLLGMQMGGVYQGDVILAAESEQPSENAGPRYLCMLGMLEGESVRAVRVGKGELIVGRVAVATGRFEEVGSAESVADSLAFVSGRAPK